jgi:hypothetical protein
VYDAGHETAGTALQCNISSIALMIFIVVTVASNSVPQKVGVVPYACLIIHFSTQQPNS